GENVFPEQHLWGARDYFKADYYKNNAAHFVSETGYHGCPCLSSLKKTVSEDALWPIFNEQWSLHSSDQHGGMGRVELMYKQVRQLFGEAPRSLDDFILASQISQAEAMKYFVERIRVKKPRTGGVIWWNLLDGWPQMSDAVVDYFFEKKLAYRYLKASGAPFAMIVDEMRDWHYDVRVCNDTLSNRRGEYTISDILTGEVLASGGYEAEANGNRVVARLSMMYSDKRMLLLTWTDESGERGRNHYLCGMPPFDLGTYRTWLDLLTGAEKTTTE
ncbi:MAG: glycoside hydrolase family 2, partial [Clostridia bacterium]|nr:glycoside hydrolase family 2 [Clostridia bacterium]